MGEYFIGLIQGVGDRWRRVGRDHHDTPDGANRADLCPQRAERLAAGYAATTSAGLKPRGGSGDAVRRALFRR